MGWLHCHWLALGTSDLPKMIKDLLVGHRFQVQSQIRKDGSDMTDL